jgi:hypothetical protein
MPADERHVPIGGFAGSLAAYDRNALTAPATASTEDLLRMAELSAGRRILEGSQVAPLDSHEWAERWARLTPATKGPYWPQRNAFRLFP